MYHEHSYPAEPGWASDGSLPTNLPLPLAPASHVPQWQVLGLLQTYVQIQPRVAIAKTSFSHAEQTECPAFLESDQPRPSGCRIIRRMGQRKDMLVAVSTWHVLDAIWKAGAGRW